MVTKPKSPAPPPERTETRDPGLPAISEAEEDIFEQRKQITRGVPTGAKHAARSRFEPTMSYRKA